MAGDDAAGKPLRTKAQQSPSILRQTGRQAWQCSGYDEPWDGRCPQHSTHPAVAVCLHFGLRQVQPAGADSSSMVFVLVLKSTALEKQAVTVVWVCCNFLSQPGAAAAACKPGMQGWRPELDLNHKQTERAAWLTCPPPLLLACTAARSSANRLPARGGSVGQGGVTAGARVGRAAATDRTARVRVRACRLWIHSGQRPHWPASKRVAARFQPHLEILAGVFNHFVNHVALRRCRGEAAQVTGQRP